MDDSAISDIDQSRKCVLFLMLLTARLCQLHMYGH